MALREWLSHVWDKLVRQPVQYEAVRRVQYSPRYLDAEESARTAIRAEAFTDADKYFLLLDYVRNGEPKNLAMAAVAETVGDLSVPTVSGARALEVFIAELEIHTDNEGMQQALYVYCSRNGFVEPTRAFAKRFEQAARSQYIQPRDANPRFAELVIANWHADNHLKREVDGFRTATFDMRADTRVFRCMDIALVAQGREGYALLQHTQDALHDPRAAKVEPGARRGKAGGGAATSTADAAGAVDSHLPTKDFTPLVEAALQLPGFTYEPEEHKHVTVGFGHEATLGAAGAVLEAIDGGQLRHIFLVGVH
jgi:hypothetical protein